MFWNKRVKNVKDGCYVDGELKREELNKQARKMLNAKIRKVLK